MKKIYRFLLSKEVIIYWIITFAVIIIVGSIVPQGDVKQIQDGKLPDILKSFLILIQANNLYRSPLFLSIMTLFFITLSISTYQIIWPIFLSIFKQSKTPAIKHLLRYPMILEIKGVNFNSAKNIFVQKKYKLANEQDKLLHFEKGKWSKSSAMIAHISLFMILFGIIISMLTSFKSTAALVPNEQISIKRIIEKADLKGKLVTTENQDWSIKVNSFKITYHPNGMIQQYFSDLSVLDNKSNAELLRKTIYVNEPLVYNGVYFYQASWGVSHLSMLINGKPTNVILQPLQNEQGSASDKIKLGNNEYVLFLDKSNQAYVFDLDAKPVAQLNKNEEIDINGNKLVFKEIVLFTGLQVKEDKGIPLVYLGFIILIISLIINYFSYNQLWLIENDGKYYLVGKATRGQYLLEKEINRIADLIEIDKNVLTQNKSHIIN